MIQELVERFWSKVDKTTDDKCWLWLDKPDRYGYGRLCYKQQIIKAHRLSYRIHNGEIPYGLSILHHCDNTFCVNPTHLYAGTQRNNMQDASHRKRFRDRRGSNNKRASINENDVREIRQRWRNRVFKRGFQIQLAEEYNTTQEVIKNVISFRSWRHVA